MPRGVLRGHRKKAEGHTCPQSHRLPIPFKEAKALVWQTNCQNQEKKYIRIIFTVLVSFKVNLHKFY